MRSHLHAPIAEDDPKTLAISTTKTNWFTSGEFHCSEWILCTLRLLTPHLHTAGSQQICPLIFLYLIFWHLPHLAPIAEFYHHLLPT